MTSPNGRKPARSPAVRKHRRAELYDSYRAAARDPEFGAELADTMSAFDPAVGDGLADSPP
ncbi:MAG: hypothetical protein ACYCVL_13475 [Gemmatimonadaceae bacterium]